MTLSPCRLDERSNKRTRVIEKSNKSTQKEKQDMKLYQISKSKESKRKLAISPVDVNHFTNHKP